MAIKKYAGLDNNYLPTDGSVPVALGSEAIELTVTSGNVSQAVSLEGYDKIAFVTEGGTNTSIDFLELLGSEITDATLEIVKDVTASSGYALKMTGIQKLVFGTRTSYVPDILKKVTLKAKKDTSNTGNLYASVVSYANGQYINKSSSISIEDYVSVVDTSSLTTSYTTNVGYIKGVGTNYIEPANNPNSPSELPATTDEIALILEATGASDIWYIDVISLEEMENSIRDIPDGEGVYSSSQNFNTRNDRITTTPANPVVTTPTTYTLNGDGSIDITFTWTFSGTGDAYNIDGFSIYTHSSDTSTPPTFSDSAVYVDANTRNFTLYGITINKYYTIGVQAYRQIDHDIALDLALSEDVIRSAIIQTTPYRPVNITPSTTSYAIQRNVSSYLGSASSGSIYIHGYYPNGMRGDIAGQILYNEGGSDMDMYLAVNAQAVDCTDFTYVADTEFTCYLVLNAGIVKPAIYDINTNTFKNDTETVSSGVVIGYVIVDYAHSETVYTIKDTFVYESAKLLSMSKITKLEGAWKYLSEATDQTDWESRVDDLGIENSFTFLAAYNAFIDNLKVGMLEVVNGTYSLKANTSDGLLLKNGAEVLLHAIPSGGLFIGGEVNTSGVISGEIDITDDSTVLLKTQRETTSGTTSSSPSGSLYSVDALKTGSSVAVSSVPAAASGTFGGKTISKACFRASAGRVQLGSRASGVISSAGYYYPTYNVWQSGALGANLGAQKVKVAVSYDASSSCYFKKNGVQQQMVGGGSKYFTFDYNAADYYEVGVMKYEDEYEEYQYDRVVYEVAAVIEGSAFWEEVSRYTTTWTTYRETEELPDDASLGTRKTIYFLIDQRTRRDYYDRSVSITLTFESASSYPAGFVFINSDASYTTLPYTAGYIDHDTHPITLNSWDSSSNKPYISGSDFVSAFSAFPSGVTSPVSSASSNLSSFYPVGESNNPLLSVAYVNYNTSYVSFVAAGGARIVYNFGGNGSSVGVYNSLAASVEKVTLPRGVIADSLIRSNENSAIGADDAPFLAAYAQTFHGNVNAPGTSKNVWGAVFN